MGQGYTRDILASRGIQTGTPADYFGPDDPLSPTAPPQVEGRRLDYPVGFNIQSQPRAYEAIKFQDLRNLAYYYDVLRLVIETRKDQMARLAWSIVPKKKSNGDPATSTSDPLIEEITEFFEWPDRSDPNGDWNTWLRGLLEDMFVIDAASLYVRRQISGKLYSLEQIDGAIIKRVIDPWGRTPASPVVAYQEILKGMPAVNYNVDQLMYMPRNLLPGQVYGFSPVEQVVTTATLALRRNGFTMNWYTEGNMPEGFLSAPNKDWSTEQIRDFQKWMDQTLTGNAAARRKIRVIPGDGKYTPIREPDLTGKMDEWLARLVCYAFSVPPTPFVTQTNRATAESAHDAAIEEGLAPVQIYVKHVVDNGIRRGWPGCKLEFAWADDREVDPTAAMTVSTGYAKAGVKTINEVRDEIGLPAKGGGDELMALTGTGYVPVDAPEPEPEPAPVVHVLPGAVGPKPGEPVATKPAADPKAAAKPEPTEAPATKIAGTFRKAGNSDTYWQTHPDVAPHARGGAGRKAAR